MYQVSPSFKGRDLSPSILSSRCFGDMVVSEVNPGEGPSVRDRAALCDCITSSASFSCTDKDDSVVKGDFTFPGVAGESDAARLGEDAPLVDDAPDSDLSRFRDGSVLLAAAIEPTSECKEL